MVAQAKTPITSMSGLHRLHEEWKLTGITQPKGRPSLTELNEISEATTTQLKNHTNDSNTFKLKHTKELIVNKKKKAAEANCLDSGTIACGVSTEWAKIIIIATSATESEVLFSRKKLMTEKASRHC